ncbi:MAG TPA: metalloregulator ArsR/SmtB family transcription factor [Steroidobacteraceae bacterium]|nr:metalloregulator ArsR/SmtB family transcription factor [Steroidobacteraceae bacterium]
MTEPQAQKQVPILAALAQSTRLLILDRVAEAGPEGVPAGDIARAIRCPASTLSFHLKELSRTGVLEARPDGRFIRYALRKPALQALAGYIAGLAGASRGGSPRGRKGPAGRSGRRSRSADAGQLTFFAD